MKKPLHWQIQSASKGDIATKVQLILKFYFLYKVMLKVSNLFAWRADTHSPLVRMSVYM